GARLPTNLSPRRQSPLEHEPSQEASAVQCRYTEPCTSIAFHAPLRQSEDGVRPVPTAQTRPDPMLFGVSRFGNTQSLVGNARRTPRSDSFGTPQSNQRGGSDAAWSDSVRCGGLST